MKLSSLTLCVFGLGPTTFRQLRKGVSKWSSMVVQIVCRYLKHASSLWSCPPSTGNMLTLRKTWILLWDTGWKVLRSLRTCDIHDTCFSKGCQFVQVVFLLMYIMYFSYRKRYNVKDHRFWTDVFMLDVTQFMSVKMTTCHNCNCSDQVKLVL